MSRSRHYHRRAKPTVLSPSAGRQFFHQRHKRAVVFIDGSNWYHKLKAMLSSKHAKRPAKPPIEFDVASFVRKLVGHDRVAEIRYYLGAVKRDKQDEKSEEMYASQQKLIAFLQKQKVHMGFGHLITYPDGSFHEKGVDILLAVDMINLALHKKYDTAYLISSDTDLVPAVQECQRLGSEVVYVGSAQHGQSRGLTQICNRTILLRRADVQPFVPPRKEKVEGTEEMQDVKADPVPALRTESVPQKPSRVGGQPKPAALNTDPGSKPRTSRRRGRRGGQGRRSRRERRLGS
jgi:uncharacterized LabA/DUF88 family protein